MTPTRSVTARRVGTLCAAVVSGTTLSIWEGTITRDTVTAHVSVLALVAAGAVTALVLGRHRQRERTSAWLLAGLQHVRGAGWLQVAGIAGWTVLVGATIGWDLSSFARAAPHLPTLSRLVGDVTRHVWGRAAIFWIWLGLGALVTIGWRRAGAR